jgi:peptide-methionine (S)-S-oxide reductase
MRKKYFTGLAVFVAIGLGWAAFHGIGQDKSEMTDENSPQENVPENTEFASFGGGCFWCVEAVFQRIEGVVGVVSGYQGGSSKNPTYDEVCSGRSGHAEVVRVEYDPAKAQYQELVEVFFKSHDPTTLNRQGADTGTQYRSVIFTYNDEQKKVAEAVKAELDKSGAFPDPIVTEVVAAPEFFEAEAYHQNYYNQNKSAPYCVYNITPKLKKLGMK